MNAKRHKRIAAGAWLAIGTALLVAGCQSFTQWEMNEQTGELYHYNWWNYYNRGCLYMNQGRTGDALSDFETCIGLRSGATYPEDHDMWRARTYGMHFLEGYFPNREAGICYYDLNQTDKAILFLEKSLSFEPSGRAKHYLNLARARKMAGQTVPAPAIALTPESETVWTRARHRTVSGTARGPGLIRSIRVGATPVFIELAEAQKPFRTDIPLSAGTNVIRIESVDLLGQRAARQLVWVADWRPPSFSVRAVERQGTLWVISGRCADDAALDAIWVDGAEQYRAPGGAQQKEVALTVKVPAGRAAELVISDLAGNRLKTRLAGDSAIACLPPPTEATLLAMAGDPLTASDAGTPVVPATAAAQAAPPQGPDVTLQGVRDVMKVFDEEIFFDGRVSDAAGVAGIQVNGKEILPASERGSLQSYFSHRLALAPGTNTVVVTVADGAGRTTSRRFVAIRRAPEYADETYRLALAVPPLVEGPASPLTALVRTSIESELLSEPMRFHVLERGKGWDAILTELRLSASDLADPRAAMRAGRLMAADMILVGMLAPHDRGATVYVRLVSADTSEIVLHADVYCESLERDLAPQLAGLVSKVEQHFPLVSGNIVAVNGGRATLSVGAQDGASSATRLIVVRKAAPDQGIAAGEVCRLQDRPVELRMKRLEDSTGIAEIVPASARDRVKEGDYVYAR